MKREERPEDHPGAAHRVRVGLTGLAVVFLLVLLAAAFFGLASRDRGPGGRTDPAVTASQAGDQTPTEPLAELGVAPGNNPDQPLANDAAPPSRRPPPKR